MSDKTEYSHVKHRMLRRVAPAQTHAYCYTHPGARVLFIDTHAGDGYGVPLPQRTLCFSEDDIDEEVSRPSPLMLADLSRQIGASGLIVCEKNRKRRKSLCEVLGKYVSSATILDEDWGLLETDFSGYDHALVVSDPCGYSEREDGGGHHVEVLRHITSQISADIILTLNMGALERIYGVSGESKESDTPQIARMREARSEYLWMEDPAEWAERLGRRSAALSPLILQTTGYKFRLMVVANYFASCIDHKWTIYRGGNNGYRHS